MRQLHRKKMFADLTRTTPKCSQKIFDRFVSFNIRLNDGKTIQDIFKGAQFSSILSFMNPTEILDIILADIIFQLI